MKRILFIIALSLSSSFAFAQSQWATKSDIESFKKRPLIVVTLNENKPYGKYHNESIKFAIENFWTFNDSVIYMEKGKYNSFKRSTKDRYAVIELDTEQLYSNLAYSSTDSIINLRYYPKYWRSSSFNFSLIEKIDALKPFMHYESMPSVFPSAGDMIFGLRNAQKYFEDKLEGKKRVAREKEAKARLPLIADKTLLIDRKELSSKVMNEAVPGLYPYKSEVTNYAKIEKAIKEKDPKYAYLQIVPLGFHGDAGIDDQMFLMQYSYVIKVVDCETGWNAGNAGNTKSGASRLKYGSRLRKKQLKKLGSRMDKATGK